MKKLLMSLLMVFALGVAVIPSYPTQGAEMKAGVYTPMFADNALENARLRDILKSDTEIFIQLSQEISTLKETIENKNLIIKDNEKTIEKLKNSGSGEVRIEYVPVGKVNTDAYNDLVNTINSLKAEKEELGRRNADLSEKLAFRSYYDSAYYEVDETNKSLTKENKYLTDANKSLEEQLKDALAKIAELEDDNAKLHVAIDNYETALFDTKAVVESQDKTITSLKDELANTTKELELRTKDVDEVNKQVNELTAKLERQEETIKGIVADLNTEIEMKNLEIEGLKKHLAEITDVDVTEYVSKIDALNKQVEELNEKIKKLEDEIKSYNIDKPDAEKEWTEKVQLYYDYTRKKVTSTSKERDSLRAYFLECELNNFHTSEAKIYAKSLQYSW